MDINLRDITKDNWVDMIDIEISKEQENFVALNSEAIAASKFYDYYVNRGVYIGNEAVGFIQYYPNLEEQRPREIFIDQFMIDLNFQGKGIGSKAFELVLQEIKNREDCDSITVCYVEGHDRMKPFFEKFGFSVVEQDEFDETIMKLANS